MRAEFMSSVVRKSPSAGPHKSFIDSFYCRFSRRSLVELYVQKSHRKKKKESKSPLQFAEQALTNHFNEQTGT